jgi:hypothetical protein
MRENKPLIFDCEGNRVGFLIEIWLTSDQHGNLLDFFETSQDKLGQSGRKGCQHLLRASLRITFQIAISTDFGRTQVRKATEQSGQTVRKHEYRKMRVSGMQLKGD